MTIASNLGGGHGGVTTTTMASLKGHEDHLYVLLDTGCSNTLVSSKYFNYLKSVKKIKTNYATAGGPYKVHKKGTIIFKLPEFSTSKEITWDCDVDGGSLTELGYDMIIGRDLLKALKMIIDFKHDVIKWEDSQIPMNRTKLAGNNRKQLNAIFQLATEPKTVRQATARVTKILDAHYEQANLAEVVEKHCSHLSKERRNKILQVLKQYEDLFDGTLGDFQTEPIHLELKEGTKPKHHRSFPVPKIHEETLKKELVRLCKIGVLKKCSNSV